MTDFYPIQLGVGRVIQRKSAAKGRSKTQAKAQTGDVPADLKQEIFERDNFTCGCCHFKSEKYQQIHFKDHNTTNHATDNLMTTCIFCHQCFNLSAAAQMESGTLIWLPEIPQHQLNNIARAIYVAQISQGPIADAARKIYAVLSGRKDEAQKRLGTDNPSILASVMSDYLSLKQYYHSDKKLDGIRLMPQNRRLVKEADLEFNQFPQILAYWRSKNGPFGIAPPQKWIALYQDLMAEAA